MKKALDKDLLLDDSIILDPGLIFNEYYNEASSNIHKIPQKDPLIVEKYLLWEADEDETSYTTWLYNDHNKNIIFEITPAYPYFYCEKEKEPNYIPYEVWKQTYQPYFVATLSRETAQQGLEQAEHFVNTVDANIIRWDEKYKNQK